MEAWRDKNMSNNEKEKLKMGEADVHSVLYLSTKTDS